MKYEKVKITIIGAGSVQFCPATVGDIMLSDLLNSIPLEICLMDIDAHALEVSEAFTRKANVTAGRHAVVSATTDLDAALCGADFVITAVEKERYHYWSQDFHLPRRYGFRQVYGENGGPGGMFHTLRNLVPMLHIARRMEVCCPNALLINYTNPEAKLVEAISRLTSIRAVGVCHGFQMGVEQVAKILDRPVEELDITGYGLNHFGWMAKIQDKKTGKDLYPLFSEREKSVNWLADWDEIGLSRIMFRTFGLWPYPGTNHIGEYIPWSDEYLASTKVQYFFDPVAEKPWDTHIPPRFVYSFSENPTGIGFHDAERNREDEYNSVFAIQDDKLKGSVEFGIPIIEAVVFDQKKYIPSLNLPNRGQIPNILEGMCVEGPCIVDADGVHPQMVEALPNAIAAMINRQGELHRLVIDAFVENSRTKLLQAILLDPTISTYNNAVALIDEMFELQKEILPPLVW